ncbi:hypothetical protein [Amycolatopsis suaedae]|uniref:hypothetical protein n=1 Tax=Amycolatopsis suaedae TaxID=2510978 RepID=UPI0013EF3A2C|nr:hypothetical protein [Amycolatopsis suaedae]
MDGNFPGKLNDMNAMRTSESPALRRRADSVLLVCGRCREHDTGAWVRDLRRDMYALLGRDAITVTVSGCVKSCPAEGVAVLLAGADGCWSGTADPDSAGGTARLTARLTHPSTGVGRPS